MLGKHLRLPLLALTLMLSAHGAAAAGGAARRSPGASAAAVPQRVGIPYNRACRRRCERQYRRCRMSRAACRRQLRRCLRACPQ